MEALKPITMRTLGRRCAHNNILLEGFTGIRYNKLVRYI